MTKKLSQKRVVKFLFGLWRISPVLVISMVLAQVMFSILTSTIAPIFVSKLLTNIADGSATMDNSTGLLIGYATMLFVGSVISIRLTIAMAYLAETKMQAKISVRIFEFLTTKSLVYHANKMGGGLVSDASRLNRSIEDFWDTMIFTVTPIIATLISVCVALGFIMWQFAIILAILSIIIIVIIIKSQIKIAPISKKVSEEASKGTAFLADAIGNIHAVKAFAKEKIEIEKYSQIMDKWRAMSLKEMKSVIIITGSFSIMMTIMNVCAFIAAILATQYHIAKIGDAYLVISYTLSIVGLLWSVSGATRNFIRVIGGASPMIDTLDEEIEVKDPIDPEQLIVSKGEIEFKNILFTHAENDHPLFNELSLKIKPGEHIGLIGRSGSGKTSLTRLLLRFSDLEGGNITIDGQDISKVMQGSLRNEIAYVAQEPSLFHRSLRENIAYGKPKATDDEIRHAAKQAHALEFIDNLPKGLDTMVGERGVKLSGGQRQRVIIARAILKDSPILILDEATSALDSESERLIQDALVELMKGRTSIVIAHRLSTIARLDRIIVLDNGKIIEQGSHKNLLAKNGIYAKLWAHQSGGFIEE